MILRKLTASIKKSKKVLILRIVRQYICETVTFKLRTRACRGTGPQRSLVCVEVLGQVLEDMTYELENISVVGAWYWKMVGSPRGDEVSLLKAHFSSHVKKGL